MSIGSQIAKRRKELGMTQQELAESLDVSFQAVSSWERDEYLPETERLKPLAMSLSTTVSWLMEESNAPEPRWELHDALYSLENMKKKVRFTAQAKNMPQTLKALKQMEQYHEGQTRNGKDKIPYIHHPLMMACHALAMNLDDDDLIATILLHDVVEDCGAKVDDLDVSDHIDSTVEIYTNRIGSAHKSIGKYHLTYADVVFDNYAKQSTAKLISTTSRRRVILSPVSTQPKR